MAIRVNYAHWSIIDWLISKLQSAVGERRQLNSGGGERFDSVFVLRPGQMNHVKP